MSYLGCRLTWVQTQGICGECSMVHEMVGKKVNWSDEVTGYGVSTENNAKGKYQLSHLINSESIKQVAVTMQKHELVANLLLCQVFLR